MTACVELVTRVACECGVVHALDKAIAEKAMASLTDLNDMDLLDAGEPEIVDAAALAMRTPEEARGGSNSK